MIILIATTSYNWKYKCIPVPYSFLFDTNIGLDSVSLDAEFTLVSKENE